MWYIISLQVIITDSDTSMISAVASVIPLALHLFCLWYVQNNLKKQCAGAMNGKGKGAVTTLLRLFTRAVFATTENVSMFVSRSVL